VRGCGKTNLLHVIDRLLARRRRFDGISPAAVYWLADQDRCALLVDEGDNLGLAHRGDLRAVFNAGHRKGGCILRVIGGRVKTFRVDVPMAIAGIGTLPLPLLHRSIVISMQRSDGTRELRRLDDGDTSNLDIIYGRVLAWAKSDPLLNMDPELPAELRNRVADNWRSLIAVADTFGPHWAMRARDAAINFARSHHEEDVTVMLLRDIRDIFCGRAIDRITSADLVAALHDLEDGVWQEYRGPNDNQQPRKLSQAELAGLLRRFDIRPRTVWPQRRTAGTKSAKGYFRHQFARAWASYCDDGPAAQPRDFRRLPPA
jgi:hypothetical protein